ncbi:MAG: deoxyribonuclease IV [bacterium]
MLFGAHVSMAGGLPNAPLNAASLGCEVFQFFTRSPRGGKPPIIDKKTIADFLANCKNFQQKEWYVHTPYFINYASSNKRISYGSINVVRQELERADWLKAKYLMTHLGSYNDLSKKDGFKQLITGVHQTLDGYKGKTGFLIEISAGSGSIIGDNFEEIAEIIHHPKLKKFNINVCYDTQHAFAGGYDMRDEQAIDKTLKNFDSTINLKRLRLCHCNDSKVKLGSRKDRHEHIGEGLIGLEGFKAMLKDARLKNINFILETKHDKVKKDMQILKKIRRPL